MQNTRGRLSRCPWELSIPPTTSVLLFTETWLEGSALPIIPGFPISFGLGRPSSSSIGPRGGVAAYIRSDFPHPVTAWRSRDVDGVLWIILQAPTCPLYLGICYLSPARSGGCPNDVGSWFHRLSNDIVEARVLGRVILAGDFNARVATLPDYPTIPDFELERHDGLSLFGAFQDIPQSTARRSTDPLVNSHGRHLLNLCSTTGLRIANGRITGDLPAQPTSIGQDGEGWSVVDLYLCCPASIPSLQTLSVCPPLCTGLDHNSVRLRIREGDELAIEARRTLHCQAQPSPPNGPPDALINELFLPEDKLDDFVDYLQQDSVQSALATLEDDIETTPATDDAINKFAERLDDIVRQALLDAGAHPKQPRPPRGAPSRPSWIRRKQRNPTTRTIIRHARHHMRRARRLQDMELLHNARREWNTIRRAEQQALSSGLGDKLPKLLRTNPREFFHRYNHKSFSDSLQVPMQSLVGHYRHLLGPETPHLPPPNGPCPAPPAAPILSQSKFSDAELHASLQQIHNGSAVLGVLKPRMLKKARHTLIPVLTKIFNRAVAVGQLPVLWCYSSITPIPKPGKDPKHCNSYRGIAVSTLPAKLYATVLNSRISLWMEANNIRSDAQFGFRPGRSCAQAAFILRTIVERSLLDKQPLYTCFVDFQQAYDSVPRHLLWHKLQQKGVDGWVLDAITTLYKESPMFIRTPQEHTSCFPTTRGVRQGCPLSPLLFGIYVDDLAQELHDLGADCPILGSLSTPCLLYADDLVHIARSPEALQAQTQVVESYASLWGLRVNASKTKVMVFRNRAIPTSPPTIHYNGEEISVVDDFKYLGIGFHSTEGVSYHNASVRVKLGECAMHAMSRRLRELKLEDPYTHFRLYDTFVDTIIAYGMEVWGPQLMAGYRPGVGLIEATHAKFLKSTLGVRSQTPNMIALAECGRWPIIIRWMKRITLFCNRVLNARDGTILRCAFDTAMTATNSRGSWAAQMLQALNRFGYDNITTRRIQDVESRLQEWYCGYIRDCTGTKIRHYFTNVSNDLHFNPSSYLIAPYLTRVHHKWKRCKLTQLRVGSHWLREETGRWAGIAREARQCQRCGILEDLQHVIFECPLYNELRIHYSRLFQDSISLNSFFSHTDAFLLASFCRSLSELSESN